MCIGERARYEEKSSSQTMARTLWALASVYVWQRRFASDKIYIFPTPVFDGDEF